MLITRLVPTPYRLLKPLFNRVPLGAKDFPRFYADTLAYWNADGRQLPLTVHELRYEDLIAAPEQARS